MKRLGAMILGGLLLSSLTHAAMTEQEAQAVLEDQTLYKQYSPSGAIASVEQAEKVKAAANQQMTRVDQALDDIKAVCYKKFFVNHCIDEARNLSFIRHRELRTVRNEADRILREDKTRQIQEKRAKAAAEPKTPPMKDIKPHRKAPSEPMNLSKKSPKAPKEPSAPGARSPRETSSGVSVDTQSTEQRVSERRRAAEEKKALEAQNVAKYEEKQREAQERLKVAEKMAAERRAEREQQKAELERTMKERQEAQERLQEQEKERSKSSLSKFF